MSTFKMAADHEHGMSLLPCCFTSFWMYIISFVFIAYTVSSTIRFYVKCLLLALYYIVISVILCVFIMLPTPASRNNLHKMCEFVKRLKGIWGIRYNVKGIENYRKDANYIIVANHQSSFDMNVCVNFMPPKTTVVVKKSALYIPYVGFIFWMAGLLFIDRRNHENAMNTMKKAADQLKKEKCNLWIFAEGTRHMGSKLLPFKKGGFHLAQQTQLPILPVVISNYEHILNFSKKRFTTGTIDITILPEVSTEGLEPSDVEKLTEKVYSAMCKVYEENAPNEQ